MKSNDDYQFSGCHSDERAALERRRPFRRHRHERRQPSRNSVAVRRQSRSRRTRRVEGRRRKGNGVSDSQPLRIGTER